MLESMIYQELAERTGGACMIGVVGPVRTGKSTFIKRFMEKMVIPQMDNEYARQRAWDELPQSGSGKTVMTVEPKFVPEEPVSIILGSGSSLSVRLADCVGYMVDGATGQTEDGMERLVTTPWLDHEVTMTEAAELGTAKVIREHSTLGIVVTTDGSICDIPREAYLEAEGRVIRELKDYGKPFVVLLNSTDPTGETALRTAESIRQSYGVACVCVNCLRLEEEGILQVLRSVLDEFPFRSMGFCLPDWFCALDAEDPLKQELFSRLREAAEGTVKQRDGRAMIRRLEECDLISGLRILREEPGKGTCLAEMDLPRTLFYQRLSERTGLSIENDGALMRAMAEMSAAKNDYDKVREALEQVRSTGFGMVVPSMEDLELEEPQIVRQNGKYSVKLKASAPVIHMLMTKVESEVSPAVVGGPASEDILSFLLQGFDGDVNRIWESNIFGKSLNQLAEEGLDAKLRALPENAKLRLRETLQRLINEESSGLICILL